MFLKSKDTCTNRLKVIFIISFLAYISGPFRKTIPWKHQEYQTYFLELGEMILDLAPHQQMTHSLNILQLLKTVVTVPILNNFLLFPFQFVCPTFFFSTFQNECLFPFLATLYFQLSIWHV